MSRPVQGSPAAGAALAAWARSFAATVDGRVDLVLARAEGPHLDVLGETFPGAIVVALAGRDARPGPRRLLCRTRERFLRAAVTGLALGLETFRANPPEELAGPGAGDFEELLAGARIEARVERATLGELGSLFLDNLRRNAGRLPGAPALRGAFPAAAGRPLLVLGSGATLEDLLPLLPSFRERSVLLAGTSALRTLHRAGIRPDLAAVIEPRACLHHVEGIPADWLGGIVLLADLATHPSHLELPWRRVVPFAGPAGDWLAPAIGQGSGVPTGGNVGTAMLVLGWLLGAWPVLAAGLDFAFAGERFYARGVPNRPHPRADVTVPSWSGTPLATSLPLASFLLQAERVLEIVAERDPRARFLALTHRGARIRGMTPVDPRGLLEALPPLPRAADGLLPAGEPVPVEVDGDALDRALAGLRERFRSILADPGGPLAGLLFAPASTPLLHLLLGTALVRHEDGERDPLEVAREFFAGIEEAAAQLSRARRTTSRW